MKFDIASSWLRQTPAVSATTPSHASALRRLSSSSCKPTNIISCCSSTPTHSSSSSSSSPSARSYSRRWYNPLRRRPFDEASTEILRHWINTDFHPLASQEKFTVVSYNILGNKNAWKHKDMYPNVPSQYMNWNHRKSNLCRELFGWNPDIICLQEVDMYYDLLSVMEKAGYVGSYKRRTGDYVDGCAMFWKADKFQLIEEVNIEFKDFGLRDNVAQISVFEMRRAKSRRLVVGNIHVLYNPSRGEVKLGQICLLSSRAQIISEKWGNVPVVLAGDFNSTPQSAIYHFLSSSELNIKLYDRRELSGQRSCHPAQVFGLKNEMSNPFAVIDRFLLNCWTDEEVKVATGSHDCHLAIHPLKLNSSYASVKGSTKTRDLNGEPLATSYHSKFFGTVDYLWYSNGLVPTRVLDTLPVDTLRKTGGLPCKILGSDHLALVSEFAFVQGTNDGACEEENDALL
ncbi:hypothetical protein LWI29_036266 [Acer saccharum]|uniref:Endonuclease/exonuclease/phosphatase domain-containing protein n=1 Tax=Acer saccharum TaxID=4024 RepID=A0AA39S9A5_ACESA|nr:hypothetical protein LWI29_036266 [Acer saccharum]KAK1565491.1 hypothetical protein Q3G72_027939 [Acer saccharum]